MQNKYLYIILTFFSLNYMILDRTLNIFPGNPGRMLIIIVITIGSYILLVGLLSRKLILNKESIILIILFFWLFLVGKIIYPQFYEDGFIPPVFRLTFISFFLFIIFSSNSENSFNKIVNNGFLWGAIIFIIVSLFDVGNYLISGERFGINQMDNTNDYAYLVLLLVFSLTYFYLTERKKKSLYLLLLVISIVLIILSGSRKALLTLMLFFPLLYVFNNSRKILIKPSRIFTTIILFVTFIFITNIIINITVVGDRLLSVYHEEREGRLYFDARFAGRGIFYVTGLAMFVENPIYGVGLGNFRYHHIYDQVSHSDYISLLAEGGIIAFILYFSIYLNTLLKLRRVKHAIRNLNSNTIIQNNIYLAGIICILFIAFGRWNYNHPATFVFLAAANQFARTNLKIIEND